MIYVPNFLAINCAVRSLDDLRDLTPGTPVSFVRDKRTCERMAYAGIDNNGCASFVISEMMPSAVFQGKVNLQDLDFTSEGKIELRTPEAMREERIAVGESKQYLELASYARRAHV